MWIVVGMLNPRRVAMAFAPVGISTGELTRESGGEMGDSGRSSRNFDIVRTGFADGDRKVLVCDGGWYKCAGGGRRDMDSLDVLEKELSDGTACLSATAKDFLLSRRKSDDHIPDLFLSGMGGSEFKAAGSTPSPSTLLIFAKSPVPTSSPKTLEALPRSPGYTGDIRPCAYAIARATARSGSSISAGVSNSENGVSALNSSASP